MSWYSDGEDGHFDEWEGCEHCNFRNGSNIEACISCDSRDFSIEGVMCETCQCAEWDPVYEELVCCNSKSPYFNERIYGSDECSCWIEG